VRLVTSGAGAAALACLDLLLILGLKRENVIMCDSKGVIYKGRTEGMDVYKAMYAPQTPHRTLKDAVAGTDIFLGLSVPDVLDEDMIASLAPHPLILALSNPNPEVRPESVRRVRSDAIIATGRSDFPNQVNNAICFPYLFRGALDVGATIINQEMKIACVKAIAKLAKAECSDVVSSAYGGEIHRFGHDYIIPKPFDKRLYVELAYAVAHAAIETGVAERPVADLDKYYQDLERYIHRTNSLMHPLFKKIENIGDKKVRIAFAEGEEERVLQAVQAMVDRGGIHPMLIGRPDVIRWRIDHLSLRLTIGKDIDVIDPNHDDRFTKYWKTYHRLMERKGVTPDVAKMKVRTVPTVIGALMVHLGDADALVCGTVGRYVDHFRHIRRILGQKPTSRVCAALTTLILDEDPLFMCDPYVNEDPTAEELFDMTCLSVEQVKRFGITPKVALVSHSNFGSSPNASAVKMRHLYHMLKHHMPDLEIEGEMHADLALNEDARMRLFPHSALTGRANLLIFPNIESANIAYNLVKAIKDYPTVGPILMGINAIAHVVSPSTSVRGICNIATLAAVEACEKK
jgi:malate dehydrogenase (oxaloacetate-decarboxylating)(NADP+)